MTGLIYDHVGKKVTHLKLASRVNGEVLAVPLSEVDFQHMDQNELQVSAIRAWQKLPEAHPPVDKLTVKSHSRTDTVFVHDVWFNPQTGKIDSYELGLLPRKASSMPSLCVKASQLAFEDGQLLAADELLGALSATFNLSVGLSRPLARWSTAYTDHLA
ncbi:hypothetical protein D3875_01740 [Deinococcus cavernae]|uniref:Uncharacterized protein n=1 Tax=Deinococcus cavernae TaxID=2320857 RepID=A0A418VGL1_9DEIO|nr:hypothetical protein [Deinococcus cavernae]RJF75251.1 hypothetical protein D3875_01740 [Deinococcus cavernae]